LEESRKMQLSACPWSIRCCASVADQNAVLSQLGAAHVHAIRCGISNGAKGIDYAKRAKAKGIRILLGVGAEYSPNARHVRISRISFPQCGADIRSRYAEPELSKAFYQKLFDALRRQWHRARRN
jgi:hypothetical protein